MESETLMNDSKLSPRPRGRRHRAPLVVGGVLAAAVAGTAAWFLVGTDSAGVRDGCDGLLAEDLTKRALGGAYGSGMSCAELGRAVLRATAGEADGTHTLRQASAMKDILLAVGDDIEKRGAPRIDPALRKPLADALAQYPDVNVILGDPTDSAHLHKVLPSDPPWKEKDGYHLSLPAETLVRVVRAVSEDPEAHAVVRGAQTRWEAERLGELPAATEPVRLANGARAFGKLDGIADDVRRGLSAREAREWDTAVLARLGAGPATGSDSGPDRRIEEGWRRQLAGTPAAERGNAVEQQCARMIDLWADGAGVARSAADDAGSRCLDNAAGNRTRAVRMLR
ncbi:hypothetical protein [Streptomyces sp. NPDC002164]|uniref:hypothetical protein n=1 Tax=Streptomyces sp. NPDC002164 TaxID=3364633 RepID=UPI0036A78C61